MGFIPSKAEPDIWLRRNGNKYEYIAVYIDDLAIAAEDPKGIVEILMQHYKFKLKGTGPITVYLGTDFFRDECGVLCMTQRKYIEKMCATFEQLYSHPSKQVVTSPIEKNAHPELDTSELLGLNDIPKYQSLMSLLAGLAS